MPEQVDLERLSTAEIRELWKQTTDRARRNQTQQRENAVNETSSEDGYHKDAFGNVIEGPAPKRKQDRYYINSSGYVVELAEGQNAPQSSGTLTEWLNTLDVINDPEVREALGEEALCFEHEVVEGDTTVLLTGTLDRNGWNVDARSNSEDGEEIKFRLSKSLTKEKAIAEAEKYALEKLGPQFKTLSEDEERMIERMAVSNRLQAFVFYIQARLPEDLANRFLELGAAGDDIGIQRFAADEKISEIVEEACAFTFFWNNQRASEEFFAWLRDNDGGRLWSFPLLDSSFAKYQVASAVDRLNTHDAPTQEDLDQMSDQEIETTLIEARKLRARNQIR
jgi:hypothetical protein